MYEGWLQKNTAVEDASPAALRRIAATLNERELIFNFLGALRRFYCEEYPIHQAISHWDWDMVGGGHAIYPGSILRIQLGMAAAGDPSSHPVELSYRHLESPGRLKYFRNARLKGLDSMLLYDPWPPIEYDDAWL